MGALRLRKGLGLGWAYHMAREARAEIGTQIDPGSLGGWEWGASTEAACIFPIQEPGTAPPG